MKIKSDLSKEKKTIVSSMYKKSTRQCNMEQTDIQVGAVGVKERRDVPEEENSTCWDKHCGWNGSPITKYLS